MKKFLKNNYILIIILFLISIILSFLTSRLLFPDYQFAILSEDGKDYISIGTKDDIKYEIYKDNKKYSIKLPDYFTGYDLNISYEKVNNKIEKVLVNKNGVETYKLKSYDNKKYDNITLFNVKRESNSFKYCFIIMSIILMMLLTFVFSNGKYKVLNNKIINIIGKKHIIITSIIILLTMFLVCGCDAKVIINCARWFKDNVDVYQFQINSRNLLGTTYAQFPYNPVSMFTYGGFFSITYFIFGKLPLVNGYPYLQVFTIKILNLIFVQITILNILNYLYNKKRIDKKKLRLIYYLSIFNPVTFYVAFLFVQLDPLSLLLISTGLVLLEKIKDNNYIGVLLVSLGLTIKTQLLVFFPIFFLSLIVYSYQKEKYLDGSKKFVTSCIILLTTIGIFSLSNNIKQSPFFLLNAKLPQAERLYYTLINYMGTTSIYVSIFFVGLAIFAYSFCLKMDVKKENLFRINCLYLLAVIFILSATIVPTPSIYVLSLPAFIVLLYDEKEILKKLIITMYSFGIILLPMLSDYGDITILLKGFNGESALTKYMNGLEAVDFIKINNIIFTVSAASMIAYSIYAITKSKRLMEGKND